MSLLIDANPFERMPAKVSHSVYHRNCTSSQMVFCPNLQPVEDDPVGYGIPRIIETGFMALGSAIGCNNFSAREVQERIDTIRDITELLPLLDDPHL